MIKAAYLAGPMRGYPEYNFEAFHRAAEKYRGLGYEIHSPAEHDLACGFNPTGLTGNEDLDDLGFDLTEAIMWDLEKVAESDAIILLPGWLKSSGAQLELHLAQFLGKEVIFD